MAVQVSLRDRRRADTVAEIKSIALGQLAADGPDALSLRAVARDLGVSVQALYHYFDSRDALVTALVTDAFTSLGDAVAAGGAAGSTPAERIVGAGLAYRRWASEHRAAFLLALGVPLPDYTAPEEGPTKEAAARMGRAFQDIVFGGWTADELRAVPLPGTDPSTPAVQVVGAGEGEPGEVEPGVASLESLPPGALALFINGWASLHGLVMLEVHGHLSWLGEHGEQTCLAVLTSYADTVDRARAPR